MMTIDKYKVVRQQKMLLLLVFISISQGLSSSLHETCETERLIARPINDTNRTFFTSYAYPKLYTNGLDCWWIIKAKQNERIKLTTFDFLTESCCDILWIFNSTVATNDGSLLVNKWSGSIPPQTSIVSPSNFLAINFRTNSIKKLKGFNISYELTNEAATPMFDLKKEYEKSNKKISSNNFSSCFDVTLEATPEPLEIASPGYPQTYPNEMNCKWKIETKENYLIQLKFNLIDFEPCCDYLLIREDGDIVNTLRKNEASGRIFLSKSKSGFELEMKTDKSIRRSGFHAVFRSVPPSKAKQPFPKKYICKETLVASNKVQTFTSPNWPQNYPLDIHCFWIISAEQDDYLIELNVHQLLLDECCDYLEINEENQEPIRLSQGFIKTSLKSHNNTLKVEFMSDKSLVNKGFQISYKQVPPKITTLEDNLEEAKEDIFLFRKPFLPEVENKFCPKEKKQISESCIRLPLWVSFRETYPCGFTTTASDDIQDLNSPKFPSLYGANERCRWHIKASPGYKVQLTIGYFETESCCDILKIWGSNKLEIRMAGSLRKDQTFISSNESGFILIFRSDSSVQKTGFRGIFRKVEDNKEVKPLPIQPQCGFEASVTDKLEQLESPGWPGTYPNNLNCIWNFTTSSIGKEIELTIYSFNTEACCDYLEVFGKNATTRIKGELFKPMTILSNGANLNVFFFSDKSKTSKGFNATIRQIDAISNIISVSNLETLAGKCKFNLEATSQLNYAKSPNYPFPYDPNTDCIWIIKPKNENEIVQVQIEELKTESCCDFLDIYLVGSDGYDRLRGDISSVRKFISRSIALRFFSDGTDQRKGFKASYISVNPKPEKKEIKSNFQNNNETEEVCGYKVTAESYEQEITSAGWPQNYPNDMNCLWVIETFKNNHKIELTIEDINTEACCDFIEVSDGDSAQIFKGTLLKNQVFRSKRNRVAVKFVSDSNGRFRGFRLKFKEIQINETKNIIPVKGKNNCTSYLVASDKEQFITSKDYPNTYYSYEDCVWIIQSSSPMSQVEVIINEVSSEDCCDYLEIYSGKDKYERFSGFLNNTQKFQSSLIVVRFFTDGNIVEKGFRLSYKNIYSNFSSANEDSCQFDIHLSNSSQTINFPDSLLYPSLSNCTWKISSEKDEKISLNFTMFETEEGCDFVQIFEKQELVANLSGVINFYSFLSKENHLLLRFISDKKINLRGFNAVVSSSELKQGHVTSSKPSRVVDEKSASQVMRKFNLTKAISEAFYPECDEELIIEDETIFVASDNYPQNYNPNTRCRHIFRGKNGRRIKMIFHDVNVEECCDYLDLTDGVIGSRINKLNMKKISKNLTFTTTSDQLVSSFFSDDVINMKGYLASVQLTSSEEDGYRTFYFDSELSLSSEIFSNLLKELHLLIVNTNPKNRIKVDLKGTDFDNCCEKIELFDGKETRLIKNMSSSNLEDTIETTTSILTIKIKRKTSLSSKNKFQLSFQSVEETTESFTSKSCGSTLLVKDISQLMMSPGFPELFKNNSNCKWLLKADDSSKLIHLFIEEFEINDCCSKVKVFDGYNDNFPLLTEFDANNSPKDTLKSSSRFLYITLRAAENSAEGKFIISYFQDAAERSTTCDLTYVSLDSPTSLTSKGYPTSYPHQENCSWHLVAENGKIIELIITDADMETCCDFLEITDGRDNRLIKKFSKLNDKQMILYSSTSQMKIRMFSDRSVGGRGFQATFQTVKKSSERDLCGYTSYVREDEIMTISTPNYPKAYLPNSECHWLLVAADKDQQIRLQIDDARIEKCCDVINIYDGRNIDAKVIGVINDHVSGSGREYTSSSGALYIVFRSDLTGSFRGFHGIYFQTDGSSSFSHICHQMALLQADDVIIKEKSMESCERNSKCFQITSEDFTAESNISSESTRVNLGGCISADECDNLTCDYISQVSNVSIQLNSCKISCCSGDLCNSDEATNGNECQNRNLDLLFLIDGSGSLTLKEFNLQKKFVERVAEKFEIGRVWIGVMQYSHWFKWRSLTSEDQTYFETHISLGNYSSFDEFSDALDAIKPHGFTSYVAHALEKAVVEDMTESNRFLDKCTTKAIVVMIDGKASDSRYLKTGHRRAKSLNVELLGVGIDQFRRPELQTLINGQPGVERNIFESRKFNELESLVESVYSSLDQLI